MLSSHRRHKRSKVVNVSLLGFVGVSPFDVNPPLFDMHATTKCNTITFMPIFPGKIVGLINWDQLTTMA